MTAQLPSKERLSDDLLGQIAFYAGEAVCHPDPNYALEYQKLAYPANVLALVNEVIASRTLLAAHEQEPVAYMCDGDDGREYNGHNEFSCGGRGIPLYTHPAPVHAVPGEATPGNVAMMASTYAARGVTYQWDNDECNAAADSWNACRAAMLNGGKS